MKLKLAAQWKQRLSMCAEADRLKAEANKLWAEGGKLIVDGKKLWAEGDKLVAEGDMLWAEAEKLWTDSDKLRAEGDKLWADAILEAYGNITLEWKDDDCILENGERYKHEASK
jgi:hypothetical protein